MEVRVVGSTRKTVVLPLAILFLGSPGPWNHLCRGEVKRAWLPCSLLGCTHRESDLGSDLCSQGIPETGHLQIAFESSEVSMHVNAQSFSVKWAGQLPPKQLEGPWLHTN